MKKKLACLVSLLMALSLVMTACATSERSSSSQGSSSGANGNSTEASALKDGKKTELRIVLPGSSSSPASLQEVEDSMSSIISSAVDATISLDILEWGIYADQMNLLLSSGEDIAAIFTFSNSKNYANSGQVRDITEMVGTYAPDIVQAFGKYMDACNVDGKLYGIPTFHEYTKGAGLICRTDILDELHIDPATIKSWDDIDGVLEKVHAAYPTMNVLVPADVSAGMLKYYNTGLYDELDSSATIGVKADSAGGEIQVVNLYATDEYKALAERAYDWNQKGYFIADATTVTDTRQSLLSAGNAFGYIGQIHPGTATQEIKNSGVDVTTIDVSNKILTTGNVNFAQYMIPAACSAPEKALAALNLLYTNADMQNLMMYGIEGKDYEIKDAANDVIGYPEGIDSSSVGWNNETWLSGNAAISHVWESDAPSIWKDYTEFNNSATNSPLYGFSYDSSSVKTEVTAMENIISKYRAVIESGYSNPAESLEKMNSELKSAGIQTMIDDAQKQVDLFINGK